MAMTQLVDWAIRPSVGAPPARGRPIDERRA
jgi:hypothetical protein